MITNVYTAATVTESAQVNAEPTKNVLLSMNVAVRMDAQLFATFESVMNDLNAPSTVADYNAAAALVQKFVENGAVTRVAPILINANDRITFDNVSDAADKVNYLPSGPARKDVRSAICRVASERAAALKKAMADEQTRRKAARIAALKKAMDAQRAEMERLEKELAAIK